MSKKKTPVCKVIGLLKNPIVSIIIHIYKDCLKYNSSILLTVGIVKGAWQVPIVSVKLVSFMPTLQPG